MFQQQIHHSDAVSSNCDASGDSGVGSLSPWHVRAIDTSASAAAAAGNCSLSSNTYGLRRPSQRAAPAFPLTTEL